MFAVRAGEGGECATRHRKLLVDLFISVMYITMKPIIATRTPLEQCPIIIAFSFRLIALVLNNKIEISFTKTGYSSEKISYESMASANDTVKATFTRNGSSVRTDDAFFYLIVCFHTNIL